MFSNVPVLFGISPSVESTRPPENPPEATMLGAELRQIGFKVLPFRRTMNSQDGLGRWISSFPGL